LEGIEWILLAHIMAFWYFYGSFFNFKGIRYILWTFGIFSPVLVCCTKINHLAILLKALQLCVNVSSLFEEGQLIGGVFYSTGQSFFIAF
jgi:hypothetical protein